MKTSIFKISVIILIFVSCHCLCSAQKLNGLEIGKKYTKEQILSELGNAPTRTDTWDSEFGIGYEYYYRKSVFHFEEGGVFYSYSIGNSEYVTMTEFIPEGIRVGDNISKVLGIGKNVTMDYQKYSENGKNYDAWYRVWFNHSDDIYIIFTKNNIITHIWFDVSV